MTFLSMLKRAASWIAYRRPADVVIGGHEDPYLLRWFVIPRNPVCNVYLHLFLRSDDDRALHDHPWASISLLLDGEYTEHLADNQKRLLRAGDMRVRMSGKLAHRIELHKGPCWTLFVTGPRYRQWGFHCPQGWRHWREFTNPSDPGAIGRGCE